MHASFARNGDARVTRVIDLGSLKLPAQICAARELVLALSLKLSRLRL
jgi:hypothetical protein